MVLVFNYLTLPQSVVHKFEIAEDLFVQDKKKCKFKIIILEHSHHKTE